MQKNTTFLSSNVRQLLRLAVEPCRDAKLNNQALQCLRREGQAIVFEDQPIHFLLENVMDHEQAARSKEWYKVVLRRLSPLFNYCHELLMEEPFDSDLKDSEFLAWLTHPRLVQEAINVLQTRDDKCATQEVLLSLTPMLERSLGNILQSSNPNLRVPLLLRDLINTKELYDILGTPILMLLLHVMLGTPQGLNLRNLVWHGFPRPGEISPVLASSLIILIFSIGEALVIQKFDSVNKRPSINLMGQRGLMAKVERIYGAIPYTVDEITERFLETILKDEVKGPILQRSHKLLMKNKFRQSLYLLIPEWECQARHLFSLVNDCPLRCLTAEEDKLYTTFDEILSKVRIDPEREEKEIENLLPVTLGDRHMELLIDLLVLPEGPRIRDKVSHGEVDLDEDIIKSVFRMCIYIIMASYNDLSRYLSGSSDSNESLGYFNDYQALFHPKRLLLDDVDEVTIQVHNLSDHPSLYNTHDLGSEDPLTQLRPRVQQCLEAITDEHFDDNFQALRRYCSLTQIQTLYRPKYEYVITGMFRRLLTQMGLTLERSMENMDDKMLKYEADELSSRQLATYARMLETVPRMCLLFQIWLLMIILNMENFDDRTDVFKMFKKMLKYAENLAHHSHISKNRWEESDEIVTKAAKLILEKDFLQRELKSSAVSNKPPSAVIQELPLLTEINTQ